MSASSNSLLLRNICNAIYSIFDEFLCSFFLYLCCVFDEYLQCKEYVGVKEFNERDECI